MSKVLSAGHICLDITPVFHTDRSYARLSDLLIPGKLIHLDAANVHTGGSVANTGLALSILGNDTVLLGKVGDDAFGGLVKQILAEYGAGGLIVDPSVSTSYSVVLAVPGTDRIFLHNPGANDAFTAADIPESALDDAILFHFGYPTLMRRMYQDGGRELTEMFRSVHSRDIATSLDLAAVDPGSEAGKADWSGILADVMPYVDFFVPSFEELCFMLDRPRYDELTSLGGDMTEHKDIIADAGRLAEKCLDMGCGAVLIKCGLSGMVYRTGSLRRLEQAGSRLKLNASAWADRAGVQPCFRADIVRSGTGAGDVSIAAFLTAVIQGGLPDECVRLAAAEGAASVSSYDALGGILPISELKRRIEAGWPVR